MKALHRSMHYILFFSSQNIIFHKMYDIFSISVSLLKQCSMRKVSCVGYKPRAWDIRFLYSPYLIVLAFQGVKARTEALLTID